MIISLFGKHFFNISTNLEWVFSRADYKQKLLTLVFKIYGYNYFFDLNEIFTSLITIDYISFYSSIVLFFLTFFFTKTDVLIKIDESLKNISSLPSSTIIHA